MLAWAILVPAALCVFAAGACLRRRSQRYLVLKTETDDLPRWDCPDASNIEQWPHIVQMAWIVTGCDGKVQERRQFTFPADDMATAMQCLDKVLEECDCVVGHNITFDVGMIEAERMRLGMAARRHAPTLVCTMKESTYWCKIPHPDYIYKWPRLPELYRCLFGEEMPPAASAIDGAAIIAKCFTALRQKKII